MFALRRVLLPRPGRRIMIPLPKPTKPINATLGCDAPGERTKDAPAPPGSVPNDFGNFNKVASSAAAERNKEPIAAVLTRYLGEEKSGVILEVACGTGQHAAHCAPLLPNLWWQPTDLGTDAFDAVDHHTRGIKNVSHAFEMDVADDWYMPCTEMNMRHSSLAPTETIEIEGSNNFMLVKDGTFAAVLAVNLTHISPYAATKGLVAGAGDALRVGGKLFIYGPFKRNGEHTSEGNATFDASLRSQNAEWGYRDIEAVEQLGRDAGLTPTETVEMPANNFMLVMTKEKVTPTSYDWD
jgi:SAM-dependent methyltransferase